MDAQEDDFFGIELEVLEKSTTIVKMTKTGLLRDNECNVRIIEPLGLSPCMIIIDNEFENQPESSLDVMGNVYDINDSNWPPTEYR